MQSATPSSLLISVWPLSRSLATTNKISVDFSSSPYLDVSVQEVPLIHLWIQCMIHELLSCGLLHSDICGSFSQLTTSFFGSQCQGIRPALFLALPFALHLEYLKLLYNCSFPDLRLFLKIVSFHLIVFLSVFNFQVSFPSVLFPEEFLSLLRTETNK